LQVGGHLGGYFSFVNLVWPILRRFMTTSSFLVGALLNPRKYMTFNFFQFGVGHFPLILPYVMYFFFNCQFDIGH